MNKSHFETVIALLTEKVQEQETKIGYLEWKCSNLKTKLEEAEKGVNK